MAQKAAKRKPAAVSKAKRPTPSASSKRPPEAELVTAVTVLDEGQESTQPKTLPPFRRSLVD